MVDKVLLLCDGGKGIGFGHYSRCKSLSDYFFSNGLESKLICNWIGPSKPEPIEHFNWQAQKKLERILSDARIVLVDSYNVNSDQFEFISEHIDKLIVIDDYRRLDDFKADLVVNPNVYGHKIEYNNNSIGGSDYVILRESFRKNDSTKEVSNELNRILVTLGGSDYRNLIPKLIKSFSEFNYTYEVVCASDEYAHEISNQFNAKNVVLHGYLNASQMKNLMKGCDLAISACGQTLHELARVGCPTIGIVIDKDQKLNAKSYQDTGFLNNPIQWDNPNLQSKLLKRIEKMKSYDTRLKYSLKGPKIIDGMGVNRLMELVVGL